MTRLGGEAFNAWLSRALGALLLVGCSCGADRGRGAGPVAPPAAPAVSAPVGAGKGQSPVGNQCSDGIDNDGDGLVDWQHDLGCSAPDDGDERALGRERERGFSVFDPQPGSRIVFVSSSGGNDANDGSSPATAVRSLERGAALLRDGAPDFLLLKRGDVWRGETLGRFLSGKSPSERMVVASYGEEKARPLLEVTDHIVHTNGRVRSYLAILGLEIVSVSKRPGDPTFDGSSDGGIRFVGGGNSILVEDCLLRYSALSVQSYGGEVYKDIELRRNVVLRNYHIDTCGTGSKFRPSGIFAMGVENLTIEGTFLDHNGWNRDQVPSACASKYNHNIYLGGRGVTVRNNVMARAASMGLKVVSKEAGATSRLEVTGNIFWQGEIGVSIGGNAETPRRFVQVRVRDNAFVQVGESNPTERELAWAVDLRDNVDGVVERNVFLEQVQHKNSFGVRIGGGTQDGVVVRDNLFWQVSGSAITTIATAAFEKVVIERNRLIPAPRPSCVVAHQGTEGGVRYTKNVYDGADDDLRYCVEKERLDADSWKDRFESDAAVTGAAPKAAPTWAAYLESLGMSSDAAYLEALEKQSRFSWNDALSAERAAPFFAGATPAAP